MRHTLTDQDLRAEVQRALTLEPSVPQIHIGVNVQDGHVIFTGSVPSYAAALEARRVALQVRGVRSLHEDLTVALPLAHRRDDLALTHEIALTLRGHVFLQGQAVHVSSARGCVTLSGDVEWHYQRLMAEHSLWHVIGVRRLSNMIYLTRRVPVAAAALQSELRQALRRHGSLRKVHVSVAKREVVLTGEVETWSDHQITEQLTWAHAGVQTVRNQVEVTWIRSRSSH